MNLAKMLHTRNGAAPIPPTFFQKKKLVRAWRKVFFFNTNAAEP
jgi:hypothetical protein